MTERVDGINQETVDHYLDIGLNNADPLFLSTTLEEMAEDLCMYCQFFEDTEEAVLIPFVKDWRARHKEQLPAEAVD